MTTEGKTEVRTEEREPKDSKIVNYTQFFFLEKIIIGRQILITIKKIFFFLIVIKVVI